MFHSQEQRVVLGQEEVELNQRNRKTSSSSSSPHTHGPENKFLKGLTHPNERPTAYYFNKQTSALVNIHVLHPDASSSLWSNGLFISQVLILLQSISSIIVACIVLADVPINHYFYLIASCVICAVLLLAFQFNTKSWAKKVEFSHTHNNTVFLAFFLWVLLSVASYTLLAVWLSKKSNSSCCGWSDSQPSHEIHNPNEFTRFYSAYVLLLISGIVLSYANIRAVICHITPEQLYRHDTYSENVWRFLDLAKKYSSLSK